MASRNSESLKISVDGAGTVSALLARPSQPHACYVFAHGAGAGMTHKFMEAVASGLLARDIATLRFQFPYMERGSKRPDSPAVAYAAVRAAVAAAAEHLPAVPLIAGGKSFGGRMTSQAQALAPLPHVAGLCFFGFPLHPAGKPSSERGKHLADINIPMLFLQGTNDKLAELDLLNPVVASLGKKATLILAPDADHSFHVPARSGKRDADVLNDLLDAAARWIATMIGR